MTTPSWPFSLGDRPSHISSVDGWGTGIDDTVEMRAASSPQWRVKTYCLDDVPGVDGEVFQAAGEWYATFIVRARGESPTEVRDLGVYPDRALAMGAVELELAEHLAGDS